MGAISDSEIWRPLLIVLAVCVLVVSGFKGRALVVCVALSLLISETFVVKPLKAAIGRARPKQAQTVRMVQLQKARPKFLTLLQRPTIRFSDAKDRVESGPSFPSGHVNDNVVIAVCCTVFFRRWGWLYFLVAGAIGYSRIYLGAHWPSDVLGTAVLGVGETLLLLGSFELLWRFLAPRFLPRLFTRHARLIEFAH